MTEFDPENWTWERPAIEPLDDDQQEEVIDLVYYTGRTGIDTSRNGRLTPQQVEGLLLPHIDTNGRFRPDNVVAITGVALLAQNAMETTIEHNRDKLPDGFRLPGAVHDFFNGVYDKFPLDDNPAISDVLIDHVPRMALGAVITAGALGLTRQLMENRHSRNLKLSIEEVRKIVAARLAEGSVRWNMPENSTLAFVGSGDMLSSILARRNPHSFMQISYGEVEGLWTNMPESSNSHRPVLEALDRADASRAKKVYFLPPKTSEEFLADDIDCDILPDRVVGYIKDLDFYCQEARIPQKPVVVFGNMQQIQPYAEASYSHQGVNDLPSMTLGQKLKRLKRDAPIRKVDPNERVKARILQIAGDRPLRLKNTRESVDQYAEKFFWIMRDRKCVDPDKEPVSVLYGRRDWSTLELAEEDDIAVVESYTQREALIKKGMPKDRVILLPEITLEEADRHSI